MHILATKNAENPITRENCAPLLALDMWEHSYMPDYDLHVDVRLTIFTYFLHSCSIISTIFGGQLTGILLKRTGIMLKRVALVWRTLSNK
jgi:hypothetical protein